MATNDMPPLRRYAESGRPTTELPRSTARLPACPHRLLMAIIGVRPHPRPRPRPRPTIAIAHSQQIPVAGIRQRTSWE